MEPKYVGLEGHQSSTVVAVHDARGKNRMECVLATEAEAIQDFLKGLRGPIHVTFEEAEQAAWLYEMVQPLVAEGIVCNPRMNKLLALGNTADRVDAHKLAELLCLVVGNGEGCGERSLQQERDYASLSTESGRLG